MSKPLQLPGCTLPGNIFLAPLAGYTDKAFREICRSYGASFTYTEMVSAEAVARKNKKSLELMERGPGEKLLGIQIFCSNADQVRRAMPGILSYKPTLIDINCGCPVPKVIKTGAGAALMRSPATIHEIVKTGVELSGVPVTVKIRSGWDSSSLNYLEAASAAVDAGAAMISLHARTRAQGYSGMADWNHIRNLVEAVPVPVAGSGDLFSPRDVLDMLTCTGCSAVMIARGAIGNPTIFQAAQQLLDDEKGRNADGRNADGALSTGIERLKIGLQHLRLSIQYKGERVGCKEMKKHLSAYTKALPDGAALRNALMRCTTIAEFESILSDYAQNHPE